MFKKKIKNAKLYLILCYYKLTKLQEPTVEYNNLALRVGAKQVN